jgi:hypothetical protein
MVGMDRTRRALFSLLFAGAPAFAGQSHEQAKRAAKQARRRAKETQRLAQRRTADRKETGERRAEDRAYLNDSNSELDKARRQDMIDLQVRREAHVSRPVVDAPVVEEPKPGIKAVVRNVEGAPAPEPK